MNKMAEVCCSIYTSTSILIFQQRLLDNLGRPEREREMHQSHLRHYRILALAYVVTLGLDNSL